MDAHNALPFADLNDRAAKLGRADPLRFQVWTYDFIFDQSLSGKSLKMLTLIDEYTRECLAVEVGISIVSERVRQVLQRVCLEKGFPEMIRSDNGSEFIAQAVNIWLAANKIKPVFIEPGKPWQNGKGESFNGKLRDECLSREWFSSVREAQVVIENWRKFYNTERPHSSLGYLTPLEFKSRTEDKKNSLSLWDNKRGLDTIFSFTRDNQKKLDFFL